MRGADRDGIRSDQRFAVKHSENVCFGVDLYGDMSNRPRGFTRSWILRFALVFNLICCLRAGFAAGLNLFYRRKLEWFDVWDPKLVASLDVFQFSRVKMLEKMNVAVKFLRERVGRIAVREEF